MKFNFNYLIEFFSKFKSFHHANAETDESLSDDIYSDPPEESTDIKKNDPDPEVNPLSCSQCGKPIEANSYACQVCPKFIICFSCESKDLHHLHPVVRSGTDVSVVECGNHLVMLQKLLETSQQDGKRLEEKISAMDEKLSKILELWDSMDRHIERNISVAVDNEKELGRIAEQNKQMIFHTDSLMIRMAELNQDSQEKFSSLNGHVKEVRNTLDAIQSRLPEGFFHGGEKAEDLPSASGLDHEEAKLERRSQLIKWCREILYEKALGTDTPSTLNGPDVEFWSDDDGSVVDEPPSNATRAYRYGETYYN